MQFPFCGSVCLRHWHPEEAGIITPVSYPRKLNLGMMTQRRPGSPDSFPCVTHPRLFPCQLEVFWGDVILYLARHSARQSPGDRTGQPSPRRASWGSRGPRRYLRRPGRGDSVQPSSGILGPNSQSSFPIIRCAKWASTRHHSWESILEQGMVSSHPLYPNQNIHKLEKKKKRPWARHSLSVSQVDQL